MEEFRGVFEENPFEEIVEKVRDFFIASECIFSLRRNFVIASESEAISHMISKGLLGSFLSLAMTIAKIIEKSILNFFKCQSPDLLFNMRHLILQFTNSIQTFFSIVF